MKMKRYKLLLIALLIVGCDTTEPEDEIKEVAWLMTQDSNDIDENVFNLNDSYLYYTNGYNPTIIDTNSYWGLHGYMFFYTYIFQGDTIYHADSVRTITHFVEPDYFLIIGTGSFGGSSNEMIKHPEDYEVFKYEYK